MNLQPVSPHQHGLRLPCVSCKRMFRAEDLKADLDGAAFKDYYCAVCAPTFTGMDTSAEKAHFEWLCGGFGDEV